MKLFLGDVYNSLTKILSPIYPPGPQATNTTLQSIELKIINIYQ